MTTIAFDGKTLAADRQMGGWINVCKIFKLKDGRIAAGAGNNFDAVRCIVAWMNAGSKPADRPDIPSDDAPHILVVSKCAKLTWIMWPYHEGMPITESFFAIGSGSEYAMGAMAVGASARKAVEVACRLDAHSGKGIDVVRIVKPGVTK